MKREYIATETEIERSYEDSIERNTQEELFELLKDKRVVRYRTKTIKAGKQAYVSIYPVFSNYETVSRIRKSKTRKAQETLNASNSLKHAICLVNQNFQDGDLWATFTYAKMPENVELAKKDLRNFIRRLRYYAEKKYDLELKCFYVTEYENDERKGKVRCHHHLITNFPNMDEMESVWRYGGRTQVRKLYADEYGYEGLVRYLLKTGKKEGSKRYGVTRGMQRYSVTIAEGKISRKKASEIVFGEIDAKEFFEKNYKKYLFLDETIRICDDRFVPGVYIYARLRLKN